MHATIFGNVTALVQRLYGTRKSDHQTKWKNLKDFAILHSLPKQLKQRMEDYFQTMWSLNHGIDQMEVTPIYFYTFRLITSYSVHLHLNIIKPIYFDLKILQDFPEELQGDVSMHLHNEILSLPIFDTATEGCKKLLSIKVKFNDCILIVSMTYKTNVILLLSVSHNYFISIDPY